MFIQNGKRLADIPVESHRHARLFTVRLEKVDLRHVRARAIAIIANVFQIADRRRGRIQNDISLLVNNRLNEIDAGRRRVHERRLEVAKRTTVDDNAIGQIRLNEHLPRTGGLGIRLVDDEHRFRVDDSQISFSTVGTDESHRRRVHVEENFVVGTFRCYRRENALKAFVDGEVEATGAGWHFDSVDQADESSLDKEVQGNQNVFDVDFLQLEYLSFRQNSDSLVDLVFD